MITYITFDSKTGSITSVGTTQNIENISQIGDFIVDVPLVITPDTHYVDTVTRELIKKPEKPVGFFKWDTDKKAWVPDLITATQTVLMQRRMLLENSDWTQLPDVPLSTKEAWGAYRQALRDITLQADPFNIIWPIAPEG